MTRIVAAPHAQQLTQLRTASVDDLLSDLATAEVTQPAIPFELDLSTLDRLERPAGAILSNALIGTFGSLPLRIKLPPASIPEWLEYSGLAFALANREGPTDLLGLDRPEDLVAPWREYWLPGAELVEEPGSQPLFSPGIVGETETIPNITGSCCASFVDPHLSSADVGSHPLNTFVWPWLDRLLPGQRQKREGTGDRYALIEDIGRLVDETVQNVTQHAVTYGQDVRSLLQVAVTHGGGAKSFDRVYLAVQDTGPGIVSTARGKVDAVARASIDDQQLLFKLFDGSLPPWGRGRGMGLPKVLEICANHQGVLHVATQFTRLRAESARPPLVTWRNGVGLKGTVIVLMLPLTYK